jgi:hypothetical protein
LAASASAKFSRRVKGGQRADFPPVLLRRNGSSAMRAL